MNKLNLKKCLNLFFTCIWIGAQMFGSGMAVVPILQKEFIEKRKWITDEELLDIMSISKCTPGAYTVNIVTFVGNKQCGFLGGVACAIGITIVPIIAIILFTIFYTAISEMQIVKSAMVGITVCVCALIINSLINLWKKAIVNIQTFIIFVIAFILYAFTNLSIIIIIILIGTSNFILERFLLKKLKGDEKK